MYQTTQTIKPAFRNARPVVYGSWGHRRRLRDGALLEEALDLQETVQQKPTDSPQMYQGHV